MSCKELSKGSEFHITSDITDILTKLMDHNVNESAVGGQVGNIFGIEVQETKVDWLAIAKEKVARPSKYVADAVNISSVDAGVEVVHSRIWKRGSEAARIRHSRGREGVGLRRDIRLNNVRPSCQTILDSLHVCCIR